MGKEIERKFLVKDTYFLKSYPKTYIKQAFLSSVPERTVRVRIYDEKGFLTIKGKSDTEGIERYEFEKEIDKSDALDLLKICEAGLIEKFRYKVPFREHLFEVDIFIGENSGLVIAEIELNSADEDFEQPKWLGKELTGDLRFYNSSIAKHPYNKNPDYYK